ncbi:hypothetical protein BC567DRAFT_297924 [Phyllosticta citribraziliensis]
MKMKVATLFLVYAVLAAGTPSAAGGGDVAAAAPEDERGVVYGARGPDILLKPDCMTNADCAGGGNGKKGLCQNKAAYLEVTPKDVPASDAETVACAFAKVLTGECVSVVGPPNDAACTYIYHCEKFPPGVDCGSGNERPNSVIDQQESTGDGGHNSGTEYGIHDDTIVLKTDCTADLECAGDPKTKTKGACQDKDAYLAIVPKDVPQTDAESTACVWAKAPNDAACSYIFTCKKITSENCGPGKERPKAYRNVDDRTTICACPRVCARARAGFQKGPKPKDECSPKGKAADDDEAGG